MRIVVSIVPKKTDYNIFSACRSMVQGIFCDKVKMRLTGSLETLYTLFVELPDEMIEYGTLSILIENAKCLFHTTRVSCVVYS